MQSMTGYGRATADFGGYAIVVEVSSVNRKNLEVMLSAPKDWFGLDRIANELAKERFDRGRLQMLIKIEKSEEEAANAPWDEAGVIEKVEAFQRLCRKIGISGQVTEEVVINIIRVNGTEGQIPSLQDCEDTLRKVISEAFDALKDMRNREGSSLLEDLQARLSTLNQLTEKMESLAPEVAPNQRQALLDRLQQAQLDLDPEDERVLKEIALFVDRSDISEELTRLKSHFDQMAIIFKSDGAIGRKMDFMVQEIFREFNTIGSKANHLEISQLVIEAKNELERFREQVQNVN